MQLSDISRNTQKRVKQLLEIAKTGVEWAIEEDEKTATRNLMCNESKLSRLQHYRRFTQGLDSRDRLFCHPINFSFCVQPADAKSEEA